MTLEENFKVLGLQSDASWDEVKAAFRRLARMYHPDVAGPEGQRKFKQISEAYNALRESISPGYGGSPSSRPETDVNVEVVKANRGSFIGSIFRKIASIFTRSKARTVETEPESEYEIPQVQIRYIGSIIAKAEAEIHDLMSHKGEIKSKVETEALMSRVTSRHPGVVLLALKRISMKDASDGLRVGILDHFRKVMPTSEVLEALLALFASTQYVPDLSKALAVHSSNFSDADAQMVIKWYKWNRAPRECFAGLLTHPSDKVIAAALAAWPQTSDPVAPPELVALLKREDEAVLIPLLRMLKREKLPAAAMSQIERFASEHPSQTVKVWASAIVRERNMR